MLPPSQIERPRSIFDKARSMNEKPRSRLDDFGIQLATDGPTSQLEPLMLSRNKSGRESEADASCPVEIMEVEGKVRVRNEGAIIVENRNKKCW